MAKPVLWTPSWPGFKFGQNLKLQTTVHCIVQYCLYCRTTSLLSLLYIYIHHCQRNTPVLYILYTTASQLPLAWCSSPCITNCCINDPLLWSLQLAAVWRMAEKHFSLFWLSKLHPLRIYLSVKPSPHLPHSLTNLQHCCANVLIKRVKMYKLKLWKFENLKN